MRSFQKTCKALVLFALVACTPAAQQGLRCRLSALDALPEDPNLVTLSDAVQLVSAVRQCKTAPAEQPDGG